MLRTFSTLLLLAVALLAAPSLVSAQNVSTRYVYDDRGRLYAVVSPAGEAAVYEYDLAGNHVATRRVAAGELPFLYCTPSQGAAGDIVTCFGAGVGSGASFIAFNGVAGELVAAGSWYVVGRVPGAATTGPVSIGMPGGVVTSRMPFVLRPALSVSPSAPNLFPNETMQFTARFTSYGGDERVTWSVNGVTGGTLANGFISQSGYYVAPNRVGSNITIRATSVVDSSFYGEASVTLRELDFTARQWEKAAGPVGGWISEIAQNGTYTFASTLAGIYRSADNGQTWTQMNNGIGEPYALGLAVDGSKVFTSSEHGVVWRSTDDGESWTLLNSGLPDRSVEALIVRGAEVFAGLDGGGVYRSTDDGQTWAAVNNGLTSLNVRELFYRGSVILAGTRDAGVFRSTDGGATWAAANTGITNMEIKSFTSNASFVFAGTWGGGIFRSSNDGLTWAAVNTGMNNSFVGAIAASDTVLVASCWPGVFYRSNNNGTTWAQQPNAGFATSEAARLMLRGANLFGGTFGRGMYLSGNLGSSWQPVNNTITNTYVEALHVQGETIYSGSWGAGVQRSTDHGQTWTQVNQGITNTSIFALGAKDNVLFAGSWGGGVYRSTDNGVTWTSPNTGLSNRDVFAIASNPSFVWAGTRGGGVFRSTDNGLTWSPLNSGLSNLSVNALKSTTVANLGWLYAGTQGGGVFFSGNNGSGWSARNTGLTNLNVHAIAIKGNYVFAGTEGGVFRSSDNTNWTPVSNGITQLYINSLLVTGRTIFATTPGGVFYSNDDGQNWTRIGSNGLTNQGVITLVNDQGYLFAGTYASGGFFSRP